MKTLKIFVLIITVVCFTPNTYTAQAADCTDYKKFSHKWNKCKLGALKEIGSKKKDETTSASAADSGETKKKSGVLEGLFDGLKKIREFGGKKVGEPG